MRYEIIHGDNMAALAAMADNSVDSVCTDPPYGLGKEPDAVKMLQAWIDHGYLEVSGSGFMGKQWDAFVPQPIFWKEVYRVLKPGGHVLSFAGTRTYDWMVMAIRLAGFEIRDQLIWAYGGGFPKSHDISKAIDKQAGAVREVVGKKTFADGTQQRATARAGIYSDQKGQALETLPSTPEAQQWDGWGTALSPSHEPIVLARKPLEKGLTIAQNVLKWGTGALNIDGCRVGTEGGTATSPKTHSRKTVHAYGDGLGRQGGKDIALDKGRWPSNLLLANVPSVLGLFPETGKANTRTPNGNLIYGRNSLNSSITADSTTRGHEDNGGSASRYFFRADMLPIEIEEQLSIEQKAIYCSKPSKYERSLGVAGEMKESATTIERHKQNPNGTERLTPMRSNFHPTVKPVALMHHLVTLITPPNGVCLDPFLGSGTTGIGAMLAGPSIRFIGLEMTAEYIPIATDRIKNWKRYRQFIEAKATDTPAKKAATSAKAVQLGLF